MKIEHTNFNQFLDFINFCKSNRFQFDPSLTETSEEAIGFYKNGNRIHIKEKNKGSFTRYCGGNVTEECIRKGKASSNPATRKKATFADNSRRFFKH